MNPEFSKDNYVLTKSKDCLFHYVMLLYKPIFTRTRITWRFRYLEYRIHVRWENSVLEYHEAENFFFAKCITLL